MKAIKHVTSCVMGFALVPQSAWAQDAAAPAAAPVESAAQVSAQDAEIVVTGSRVARSTFTSMNPVTVIGAQQIAQQGQVNIGETIQTMPQNFSKASVTNVGLAT